MTEKSSKIPKGWRETTLGKVGIVITGKTPSKDDPEDWGDLLDFITPTDIVSDSKYLKNVARKLSREGIKRFQRMIIPSGSVVVTCIGSDMGKVVINGNDSLTNQQINSIKVNLENDKDYIYYILKNSYFVLRHVAVGGSTMPILNKSTFESLDVALPLLPEQKAVAEILSSLDDKIELLRMQNKTLENIVQALFIHWFIDFEFPDKDENLYKSNGGEMIDSELGEIPKKWRVGHLGEVTEVRGGTTPRTEIADYWNGDIHWTSPKDLSNSKDMFMLDTEKKITEEGLSQISSGLLPKGTLLLSSRAPIGYLAISDISVAINQGYIALLPGAVFSTYYMYLWLKENMREIISASNGSTFLEISKGSFKTVSCIIPEKIVLDTFQVAVTPLFEKVLLNICQIRNLSKIRDSILPKLIKGDIRVKGFN
jgi:type I restriction enzyme S subunit